MREDVHHCYHRQALERDAKGRQAGCSHRHAPRHKPGPFVDNHLDDKACFLSSSSMAGCYNSSFAMTNRSVIVPCEHQLNKLIGTAYPKIRCLGFRATQRRTVVGTGAE